MAAKMLTDDLIWGWIWDATREELRSFREISEKLLCAVEKHAECSDGETLEFVLKPRWGSVTGNPISFLVHARKLNRNNQAIAASERNRFFLDGKVVTKNEAFQGPDAIEKAAKEIAAELNIGQAP